MSNLATLDTVVNSTTALTVPLHQSPKLKNVTLFFSSASDGNCEALTSWLPPVVVQLTLKNLSTSDPTTICPLNLSSFYDLALDLEPRATLGGSSLSLSSALSSSL